MEKRWLYIPIETTIRELHGKLLLACFAAIKGFSIVIGSKKDISFYATFLPKGTVFNIGLAKNMIKNSEFFKKYGHRVAAIDEEGIVTLKDDIYLRQRVSKDALRLTDLFFCWGPKQESLIKKKLNGTGCQLFITGNPRFDMLKPEYRFVFNEEVKKIRGKYGKFILINTNFGRANHFSGYEFMLKSLKDKGWMNNQKEKEFILKNIEWQKRMFRHFQEMVPQLAESYKNFNIIVRPHPSENHVPWKEIEKKFSNVFVVHSGNVIPWLIAAKFLIHNGCTTAIESFLLGIKAIAYRPFTIEEQETKLPNKISFEVFDIKGLLDAIDKIFQGKLNYDYKSKKNHLDLYLDEMKGKTASEKIVNIIRDNIQTPHKEINYFTIHVYGILRFAKESLQKTFFKTKFEDQSNKYVLHKMPELTKKEIIDIIDKYSKINNEFSGLKIDKIGPACYHIFKDK